MPPVDLTKLDSNEFKSFLSSFDHVFSDCDGVIWSKSPLPGSGEFFKLMQKLGKTVHYVSNNSLRSRESYEKLFNAAGIEGGFDSLTLPSLAIAEYLKSVNFDKHVYCVCCSQTTDVLQSAGFHCKTGPDVIGDSFFTEIPKYIQDDPDIGAVVFDCDFKVNLPKLIKAKTYLNRTDVLFLSGATDKYINLRPGQLDLGTGAFTDLVTEQIKREPIQLGKPGKIYGEFAMKRAGVTDASRVLFIGDMIDQDIVLGKATGFKTMLVLTSIPEDKMMAHDVKPDYFAPSLGSLVEKLNNAYYFSPNVINLIDKIQNHI